MAEARSAIHALDVKQVIFSVPVRNQLDLYVSNDGVIIYLPHPKLWARNGLAIIDRAWKSFARSMWPLPPLIAAFLITSFPLYVVNEPASSWYRSGPVADALWNIDSSIPYTSSLPVSIRVIYLAWLWSILVLYSGNLLQKWLCRVIMAYKGWLYDAPGKTSATTKIWGLLMKVCVIGLTPPKYHPPTTYAFSRALPRMTVPELTKTVTKFYHSVEGIVDEETMGKLKQSGKEFIAKSGPKLQMALKAKSWLYPNYVSDWWLTHVYLRGRGSLMINSNYYGLACNNYIPSKSQCSRAANMIWWTVKWAECLRKETLPPQLIRGIIPLCMEQYRLCISTTRIPQRDVDVLKTFPFEESHHIVVVSKGVYYVVDPFVQHDETKLLSPLQLESQIQWIMEDSAARLKSPAMGRVRSQSNIDLIEAEKNVAVLTSMNRTEWATVREEYFSTGVNKASLSLIESAMFVVILDDECPTTWTQCGKLGIHGKNGTNRWFDKSFNMIIYGNGQAMVNGEHSWGDAPVVAHMLEWVLSNDIQTQHYTKEGSIDPAKVAKYAQKEGNIAAPKRLQWAFLPDTVDIIQDAVAQASKDVSNFDLVVSRFDKFGKRKVKKLNVAPDAFLQSSLLLAYYRDSNGKFPCTYESSMTRLFQQGRTETIRSCSTKMTEFVKAFENDKLSVDEKRHFLLEAASKHKDISNEAMIGEGIDRHLFALYVTSVGLGVEAPFLKEALSMPWLLSTSQLPQRQSENWKSEEWLKANVGVDSTDLSSPSGGFGPVHDDGYGVSYMVATEDAFYFHVSSKRGSTFTDSQRFTDNIHKAMNDIMKVRIK